MELAQTPMTLRLWIASSTRLATSFRTVEVILCTVQVLQKVT